MRVFVLLKNSDKYVLVPVILTGVTIIFMTLLTLITLPKLPQNIPLFYSLPWGSPQLADKSQLFLLSIIVATVSVFNFAIYTQLHASQIILKKMLLLTLIAINLIFLITMLKIISIFF